MCGGFCCVKLLFISRLNWRRETYTKLINLYNFDEKKIFIILKKNCMVLNRDNGHVYTRHCP